MPGCDPSLRSMRWNRGFTLLELMVVIVIVATLAALLFSMAVRGGVAADKASCVNRLKQSAGVMLSRASENSGQLILSKGGPGNFELRPYLMIANELGLENNDSRDRTMSSMMSCPSIEFSETNPHWHCYGVNFIDSEERGVTWRKAPVRDSAGRNTTSYTLFLASIRRSADHILVADSCHSSGKEIFRISGEDLIGLRHGGSANAAFVDGSVRSLSRSDLGRLGFEKAYDTSEEPPVEVNLKKGG